MGEGRMEKGEGSNHREVNGTNRLSRLGRQCRQHSAPGPKVGGGDIKGGREASAPIAALGAPEYYGISASTLRTTLSTTYTVLKRHQLTVLCTCALHSWTHPAQTVPFNFSSAPRPPTLPWHVVMLDAWVPKIPSGVIPMFVSGWSCLTCVVSRLVTNPQDAPSLGSELFTNNTCSCVPFYR
jgi:hypothetical protein